MDGHTKCWMWLIDEYLKHFQSEENNLFWGLYMDKAAHKYRNELTRCVRLYRSKMEISRNFQMHLSFVYNKLTTQNKTYRLMNEWMNEWMNERTKMHKLGPLLHTTWKERSIRDGLTSWLDQSERSIANSFWSARLVCQALFILQAALSYNSARAQTRNTCLANEELFRIW